jgi:hypothetical protein
LTPLDDAQGRGPIVQYWHGDDIPPYIEALISTVREHNPDRPHLLFDERSAAETIAENFGERHLAAFQACAVPSMQADYFRYCAIHSLGGIYLDADLACIACLDTLVESEAQLFKHAAGPMVNSFFGFPDAGHPLLEMTVEIATVSIEKRWTNHVGFATGPLIFTGLERIWRAGSPEALRGTLDPVWARALELARPVIEAHGPIERAFDGVRISPGAAMSAWIAAPDQDDLLYKKDDQYWFNWQGSIYRSAPPAPR